MESWRFLWKSFQDALTEKKYSKNLGNNNNNITKIIIVIFEMLKVVM